MQIYVRQRRPPSINIVSLIDILTILLIFIVVTTTFKQEQPAVEINLPEAKSGAPKESQSPTLVYVTDRGEIFVEKDAIRVEQLAAKLKALIQSKPGLQLAMKADEKASFGIIIKVLDAFKEAGIQNIPAFTEAPGGAAP